MSAPDPDCEVIVCYGGAKPSDLHTLSTVRAVDDGIIEWLERRKRRRYRALLTARVPLDTAEFDFELSL
jgi:hypothetical protein